MPELEAKIKDFARKAGAKLVGVAGPDRIDGPPSLNPGYELRGAKSIVALVLPLSVGAIYEFFGKVSPVPHNIDQAKINQRMHRISREVADYIVSLGYEAKAVVPNNNYRRCLDPFATRPTFSHRFGAVVAGIGSFGLSGNVVTKEYGSAVVLGTVVTNAGLKSDPVQPARFVMDNHCKTCKLCDKACTMGMFREDEEEYLLLNGELHPRGKRDNLDFCNAPCFGFHAISRDKKWTNWGQHWIKEWTDSQPDPTQREKIRQSFMGMGTGDATIRFQAIVRAGHDLYPRELIEDFLPDYEQLTRDENERVKILLEALKRMGSHGLEKDPNLITCSQCMLVCGPDFDETKKRYDLLTSSGYVVPGPDWKMIHVKTYEEAAALKAKYPRKLTRREIQKDAQASGKLWMTNYFGIEPVEEIKGLIYQAKAKKACAKAGLAGKEAQAPIITNPSYLLSLAIKGRKKKKNREAIAQ